jgi:class 3 adenylate cyclase/GAF domain-containing protein
MLRGLKSRGSAPDGAGASVKGAVDELVRASSMLSRESSLSGLISVFVEQALDISRSDLACLYLHTDLDDSSSNLRLAYRRGTGNPPEQLPADGELISFLTDCRESVVVLDPAARFFRELLLDPAMQCGIALPLVTRTAQLGALILNAREAAFYNRDRFYFLDSFGKLAGGMFHNTRLFEQLQERLKQIEALERYQENIFSSMTNLLVTTDKRGQIQYYNDSAEQTFRLEGEHIGRRFDEVFARNLDENVLKAFESSAAENKELLGLEGIYEGAERQIDFAVNVAPLRTKRGKYEGLTLLFTDQSRERALRQQMDVAVEERRQIKNMFARYLSNDVVNNLMQHPELVKPGGDKKTATVFFGDIRGYTTFSETKSPEYIIDVLNAYFSVAVEIIVRHKGYIDKFIGDAIMAAWGVPMATEEQDAIEAVECALEIQDRIKAEDRTFFTGDAAVLKVGIGMHTGSLVAGNLGSDRRMDYSVIGDTVNVAARLEGVAGAGEVVITEHTRERIGDRFKLEEREPVKVKGKEKPIHIFNVLGRVS